MFACLAIISTHCMSVTINEILITIVFLYALITGFHSELNSTWIGFGFTNPSSWSAFCLLECQWCLEAISTFMDVRAELGLKSNAVRQLVTSYIIFQLLITIHSNTGDKMASKQAKLPSYLSPGLPCLCQMPLWVLPRKLAAARFPGSSLHPTDEMRPK